MKTNEVWVAVHDYPIYAVSSLGRVKRVLPDRLGRLRGPYLKGTITVKGYLQVALWRDGIQHIAMVHRLVCRAFRGAPIAPALLATHRDGNSLNNDESNLRWATCLENEQDKRLHGTVARGEKQGASKLTELDVRAIRKDTRSQRRIAADYGITQANVSSIVLKKSWAHIT